MLALLVSLPNAWAQPSRLEAVPGHPILRLGAFDLAPLGYTVEEFFLSGEATSYALTGAAASDGHWNARPAGRAPFVTRLVVVRPVDSTKFNGTVILEWMNVSGGVDTGPDWTMTHRALTRDGFAWVGVSAQRVGVEGGPNLMGVDMPLKKVSPERYGRLSHPGDAFSYDIFTQAGRTVRKAGAGGVLGPLKPRRVIAAGESQSAVYLTTYVNAVDPLAKVFDGFFVHSRFGPSSRLDGAAFIGASMSTLPQNVRFRSDLRVPVMAVITETDLKGAGIPGYLGARQPDASRLRVWEIAGTAHADNYMFQVGPIDSGAAPLEDLAAAWTPMTNLRGQKLEPPINFAPQHHYVVEAALSGLDHWLHTGRAPPSAPPMVLSAPDAPVIVRDAHGLAVGGVRTPWVDVPLARLTGERRPGSSLVVLFGEGEPFDAATLAQLYPGGEKDYLARFQAALDAAIRSGFILAADRQEILDLAAASYRRTR